MGPESRSGWWGQALFYLAMLCPLASFLRAIVVRRSGGYRWTLLAVAVSFDITGSALYDYVDRRTDAELASGLADVAYLLVYVPLLIVAAFPRPSRSALASAVDGLIAGAAVSTGGILILQQVIEQALGSEMPSDVPLIYVALDVLGIAMLVANSIEAREVRTRSVVLLGFLALVGTADVLYALQAAGVISDAERLFDVGYVVAFGVLGLTPWVGDRVRIRRADERSDAIPTGRLLPTIGSFAGLGVLFASAFVEISSLITCLAAVTVAVALGRTMLTMRDLSRSAEHFQQARTDHLTGIANRRAFMERLAESAGPHREQPSAVCLIDLDGFKAINDTLGHGAGDEVLRAVARRVEAFAGVDNVARLGGDEFGYVIRGCAPYQSMELVDRVAAAIAEPIEIAGLPIVVESSTGVVLVDQPLTVDEMMRRSDVAMYRAKRSGIAAQFYSKDIDVNRSERRPQLGELRTAFVADDRNR